MRSDEIKKGAGMRKRSLLKGSREAANRRCGLWAACRGGQV